MPVYRDIQYSLERSKRKTGSIYVERDGSVSVRVPDDLTDAQIEGKRAWIYRNLAEWRALNIERVERDCVNGEGFLYLGRSYRLKLMDEQDEPLKLKDGYFCLRRDRSQREQADRAFRDFYREKGRRWIAERMDRYKRQMDVEPKSIRVMELGNRWASCSPKEQLNFHWKCMMAPARVLDYILIHELAHLLHPNHTSEFWREIEKLMPDYQERKAWQKANGARMDL
jgi:predicted metal-dependent hydrolase